MQIIKARKKPVEVDVAPFNTFKDVDALVQWIGPERAWYDGTHIVIATLEGHMRADLGDWIIRGVKGEFYPCKPRIFEATYDYESREDSTTTESRT